MHSPRSICHLGALGSVMEITDMNEAEVVSYRYNPYGAVTITVGGTPQSSDPLGNPWMYTSRFTDEETGLYYYRATYYSPETGRFLQRDPLGYDEGPDLYEYVRSSPIGGRDPRGLGPPTAKEVRDAVDRFMEKEGIRWQTDHSRSESGWSDIAASSLGRVRAQGRGSMRSSGCWACARAQNSSSSSW